ncbi:MAG: ribose 5-phosphate isomerase B [Fulvivirga sp.]
MKVAIGADHAGVSYKSKLIDYLKNKGFEIENHGTDSEDSVDYPDFAHPVAESVESGKTELGVLICGSANGVAMAANKHQGIRAAICWNEELAALAKQHNNANILCIPARFVAYELAEKITDSFFETSFEGGRHERRVNKIGC